MQRLFYLMEWHSSFTDGRQRKKMAAKPCENGGIFSEKLVCEAFSKPSFAQMSKLLLILTFLNRFHGFF
jgi:hypothetical protein